MATVFIAMPLRRFTGGQATVQVTGATLREVVERLEASFPGIRERLVDGDDPDRLAPGLSAIVDGEATVLGLRQPLEADSEVHFLPAIAGGAAVLPSLASRERLAAKLVIPAKAGIQPALLWIPASAGMTRAEQAGRG